MISKQSLEQLRATEIPSPKDWLEDFAGENGKYQNRCTACGQLFTGHKGRVACKECFGPVLATPTKAASEQGHYCGEVEYRGMEQAKQCFGVFSAKFPHTGPVERFYDEDAAMAKADYLSLRGEQFFVRKT